MESKYLYMAVTNDKYETPVYIEDSLQELVKKTGAGISTITRQIRKGSKSRLEYKFVKVVAEDCKIGD